MDGFSAVGAKISIRRFLSKAAFLVEVPKTILTSMEIIPVKSVDEVLKEIDAYELPTLMVYNKVDLLDEPKPRVERNSAGEPTAVWVSALQGEGLEALLAAVVEKLPTETIHKHLRLQPSHGALRAALYSHKAIVSEKIDDQGVIELEIKLPEGDFFRILKNVNLKLQDLVTL